jgi:hypothetical protein
LDFRHVPFVEKWFKELFPALSSKSFKLIPNIQVLNISNNQISEEMIGVLGNY